MNFHTKHQWLPGQLEALAVEYKGGATLPMLVANNRLSVSRQTVGTHLREYLGDAEYVKHISADNRIVAWTDEQTADVIKQFSEGTFIYRIGAEYGVSAGAVTSLIDRTRGHAWRRSITKKETKPKREPEARALYLKLMKWDGTPLTARNVGLFLRQTEEGGGKESVLSWKKTNPPNSSEGTRPDSTFHRGSSSHDAYAR